MNVFYCGCIGQAGHYVWQDENTRMKHGVLRDLVARSDGFFAPMEDLGDDGATVVHYVHGYTVFSWWDASVDDRPGSNSTFWVEGVIPFLHAITAARKTFPSVFARLGYELYQSADKQ